MGIVGDFVQTAYFADGYINMWKNIISVMDCGRNC